jgi:ABC-type transport system involved in multi-copper enzyme maturation permease subunit
MIGQIAKKEIHHNLYSIRFPALLVISAILFVLNGILTVTEPVQEIHKLIPSTVNVRVSRQYDRLQFCVRGASADRIQNTHVRIGGSIVPLTMDSPSQLPVGDRLGRFALPHADHIDWMFIIKMIFGLFAIIFTFDAICWEREHGTLTLMCANSISRSSVLLGKYLGTCGTLLIPLIVGVILNLLIILIMGGVTGVVSLQTEHWLRIGLLILASILYISLFILLGLLVSSVAQRSSSSLLILLSFWVALVIVLPNLAGILAEQTSKTESEYQLSRRQRQIWNLGGISELNKQIDSGKIKTQEELDRASQEIFTKMMKIINDTQSEHRDALIAKRRSARRIAMVSPAAVYQYVSE